LAGEANWRTENVKQPLVGRGSAPDLPGEEHTIPLPSTCWGRGLLVFLTLSKNPAPNFGLTGLATSPLTFSGTA